MPVGEPQKFVAAPDSTKGERDPSSFREKVSAPSFSEDGEVDITGTG